MRVGCEACEGRGWVRSGEWGRRCAVCGGRATLSEYRIAKLGASVVRFEDAAEVQPMRWTRRALRDLRRGRGLGPRRALVLVSVLRRVSELPA